RRTILVPLRACDGAPRDVDTDRVATPPAAPAHFVDLAAPDRTGSRGNLTTGPPDGASAAGCGRTRCRRRARSPRPAAQVAPHWRTTRADPAYGARRPTSRP